jgi:hypothetical protein
MLEQIYKETLPEELLNLINGKISLCLAEIDVLTR